MVVPTVKPSDRIATAATRGNPNVRKSFDGARSWYDLA
jgi:hypothetical protein